MKKLLLLTTILTTYCLSSFSQIYGDAIGLRFSNYTIYNAFEVSYRRATVDGSNRHEISLGYAQKNEIKILQLSRSYQFNMNIIKGFNWYIGAGGTLLIVIPSELYGNIRIGGQLGIEYDFSQHKIPILLCLDTKPMIQVIPLFNNERYKFLYLEYGLSLMYTF